MKDNLDKEILFQEWKTCVEMADSISRRRDNSNMLYVTLNLALIAVIARVWNAQSLILTVTGLLISIIWVISIIYYKNINKAKFKVITKMEKELPFKAYTQEWTLIEENKKHKDGTTIEIILASVFVLMYSVLFIIQTRALFN